MSKKLYEESNIQEIASAIREKNEVASGSPSSETYRAVDMAPAIRNLPVINPSNYRTAAEQDVIDNAQNDEIDALKNSLNDYRTAEDQDIIDNAQTAKIDKKAPAIYKDAAGSIVSFDDGAEDMPLQSLKINIEPQQDLHGYDHPWPAGGGKNLLDLKNATYTTDGITAIVKDGIITISGTARATFAMQLQKNSATKLKANTAYILNGCHDGQSGSNYYALQQNYIPVGGTEQVAARDFGDAVTFTPKDDNDYATCLYIGVNTTFPSSGVKLYPMIRLATETDATFAPYSNICPITGWTGAKIYQTGKNLFDKNASDNVDGKYINTSGSLITPSTDNYFVSGYIPCKPDTQYSLNNPNNNDVCFYDINKSFLSGVSFYNTFMAPNYACFLRFDSLSKVKETCQLELGSAATDYEPYAGTTISITFPTEAETVYGGTLTLNPDRTGTLIVDSKAVDMGTLTYAKSNTNLFYVMLNSIGAKPSTNTIESMKSSLYHNVGSVGFSRIVDYTMGSNSSTYMMFKDPRADTITDFSALVSGQTLQFKLATPVTYNLTAEQITTLLGENNIWTDVGDIELIYPADTKTYIDDYQNTENLFEPIPGTTQTVNFDTLGKPASIVHTKDQAAVRTDSFVWTDNTVTETRTLTNGKHIVMATDLTTLVTTISEIQEGT